MIHLLFNPFLRIVEFSNFTLYAIVLVNYSEVDFILHSYFRFSTVFVAEQNSLNNQEIQIVVCEITHFHFRMSFLSHSQVQELEQLQ